MNKKLFLIPAAALILASCSEKEVDPDMGQNIPTDPNGNCYITVGLINNTGLASRDGSDFESGLGKENQVDNVRFYFFNNDGSAALVKYNGVPAELTNWYDYSPSKAGNNGITGNTGSDNVEMIVNATIILNTQDFAPSTMPTYLVAVLNPTENLGKNLSLEDLKKSIDSYSVAADQPFLMSNSVYYDGSEKCEINISSALYNSAEMALANAVTINVERVAAKVRLNIGMNAVDGHANTFETGMKDLNGNPIYVEFLGWNVTTTVDKTYLFKHINGEWNSGANAGAWAWNIRDLFRSYWAANPSEIKLGYTTFDTENGDMPLATDITSFVNGGSTPNYTYLRENASNNLTTGADPEEGKRSQVIIAAQLLDHTFKPMPYSEFAMMHYEIDALREAMYASLGTPIYVKIGEVYKDIADADPTLKGYIDFITSTVAGKNDANGKGTYNVYAQLKSGNTYSLDGQTDLDADGLKNFNEDLRDIVGPAKIWNGGKTYYYIDIAHLGNENSNFGQYGVVRNHLYDITVKELTGLGTPVYDPAEPIIPEKPVDNYGMIAAQINILAWRIVPQAASLEW